MRMMKDSDGTIIVQVQGNLENYYMTGASNFGVKQVFYQKILDLYDEYEWEDDPKEALLIRADIACLEHALIEIFGTPID